MKPSMRVQRNNGFTSSRNATSTPGFDSHVTTSLLCQLSSAIFSNSALPPYLAQPRPFLLARMPGELDKKAMRRVSVWNLTFSGFACRKVTIILVSSGLKDLVEDVKSLVGKIDFDVYVKKEEAKRD